MKARTKFKLVVGILLLLIFIALLWGGSEAEHSMLFLLTASAVKDLVVN